MGCSKNTKKCYHGWTPGPGAWPTNKSPTCCRKAVKELVFYTAKLLTQHNIKFWMDFGTALGAVRENAIIQWDKDADFGLLEEDYDKILSLKDQIHEESFDIATVSEPGVIRIYYSKVNRNQLDLFFWRNENEIMVSDHSLNKNKFFPSYFIQQTPAVHFYDKMIPAPYDVEKFLEYRFGDWKTPKRKWDKNSYMTQEEIIAYCVSKGWSPTKMLL
jgi:fukutin-related protein